ncbi:uncharacterized protein LOC143461567 isoform X1 [Clavelina lepadiformis]|uniref:uncharacterized protein LOC143461567 isoform X1 n=1 Tax=Clavelina lepadiformis TaxID=159417 RepID=UPI0040434A26
MDEYTSENMATVLKHDQKDLLLTNKDPHLSHLYDHNGPNTPNSVSAEGLTHSMEVEGSYSEGTAEPDDYQLFEEQGGSYMPGFSSDSSHLVLDAVRTKDFIVKHPSNKIKHDENNNRKSSGSIETSKGSLNMNCGNAGNSMENAFQHLARPAALVMNSSPSKTVSNAHKNVPHLASPPADHYNMQLLAYSAQRQQQLLQEEQQRKQQLQIYGQGSSSATLQHLAKLRQQQESDAVAEENSRLKERASASPFHQVMKDDPKGTTYIKPVQAQFLLPGQQNILAFSSSPLNPSVRKSPFPNISTAWHVSDRGTPDILRSHIRDLSFGSQDSPILPLQTGEMSRHSVKNFLPQSEHKYSVPPQFLPAASCPEPELKSPLDHPEHQLDHQQRRRFFSSDSRPTSSEEQQDDEAPLNERDKEAAAALSVLLEQSEKASVALSEGFTSRSPSVANMSDTVGSALPVRLIHLQQDIRNTPPPAYEHSLSAEQTFQQYANPQQMAVMADTPPLLSNLQLGHDATNTSISSGPIKKEPISPAVTFEKYFMSNSAPHQASLSSKTVDDKPNLMLHQVPKMESHMSRQSNLTSADNKFNHSTLPIQDDPYGPLRTSVNTSVIVCRPSVTSAKASTVRSKRTNSTGSTTSKRRKSDGSLTCSLCGHSFRSTPALNGHMRVHSNSDKKHNKEERQKSASTDHTVKAIVSSPVSRNTVTPAPFVNIGQSSSIVQPALCVTSDAADASSQPLIPESVAQHAQPHPHNGLLTMASAACFLKTEPGIRPEYLHQPQVLQQAYVVPHPMLFQQSPMMNVFAPGLSEASVEVRHSTAQSLESQGTGYSQLYATQFQQGLPFNFLPNVAQPSAPMLTQDGAYNQHASIVQQGDPHVQERESITINPQAFVNSQTSVEKQVNVAMPEEMYPTPYDSQQMVDTNSLSQLASIAVATANRNMPVQSEFQPAFVQNDMNPTAVPPDPSVPSDVVWMQHTPVHPVVPDECVDQQNMYGDPTMPPQTSPIRSGHDPFILPVSVPVQERAQGRYGEYSNQTPEPVVPMNRETTVTWQDHHDLQNNSLLSSYDDQLMQEAINVANPSKILPNSMMGGTPPIGSAFSSGRPFRQRHYSEGAHLIKPSETSILKQMLHSPVPTVKLRNGNDRPDDQASTLLRKSEKPISGDKQNTPALDLEKQSQSKKVEPKKEVWAEPKPVQRRIRRRRHSADCRLLSKYAPITGAYINRPPYAANPVSKKPGSSVHPEVRTRHRPPPLVIPSSVNTFAPHPPSHPNFYQSHLHHRRRPSGESNSSFNGMNDKIPPYTPPPMLSPIRAGSGLYCMTPVTSKTMFNRQKSLEVTIPTIVEVSEEEFDDDDDLVRSSEPKINIGSRFQAVIPDMLPKETVRQCKHKADRVWGLSYKDANNNEIFKHTQQFLELSCSSVVPFGGANKEYALDCMAKTNGNILAAVKKLIAKRPTAMNSEPRGTHRCYIGCGKAWTAQEAKLFDCAMLDHRKDFFVISKMVKTRTTAECIERYYHIVKRNRRRIRVPRRYRDQDHDISMVLSNINEKIETSVTSASSSDEETDLKPSSRTIADRVSWMTNPPYGSDSSNMSRSHLSPPQHGSNQHAIKAAKKTSARQHHSRLDISPAGSPASNISTDEQPPQIFTCPVCGKSFGKVKSRNAHMKTHGKHAQEKRRQREEDARRREEMANRRVQPVPPRVQPIHTQRFIHPANVAGAQLYQHPQHNTLHHPHGVIQRFTSDT